MHLWCPEQCPVCEGGDDKVTRFLRSLNWPIALTLLAWAVVLYYIVQSLIQRS